MKYLHRNKLRKFYSNHSHSLTQAPNRDHTNIYQTVLGNDEIRDSSEGLSNAVFRIREPDSERPDSERPVTLTEELPQRIRGFLMRSRSAPITTSYGSLGRPNRIHAPNRIELSRREYPDLVVAPFNNPTNVSRDDLISFLNSINTNNIRVNISSDTGQVRREKVRIEELPTEFLKRYTKNYYPRKFRQI